MADRLAYQDSADFHPGVVIINLQFTAGTSGAVPSRTAAGSRFAGITSVVLSGTGLYTVTFQDTWYSVIAVQSGVYQATFDKTHGGMFTSTPTLTTTSSVALQCRSTDGNGTAVALTSGDVMWARFVMTRQQGNG
jgi:hypothetical protein